MSIQLQSLISGAATMSAKTRDVTDTEFQHEVLDSSMPVLVDFWAEWCAPCKMLSPIVDDLASQFEGKVQVVKVDADQGEQIMQQYQVLNIPTLLLFKNGEEVERISGFKPKDKILDKLNAHLN